MIIRVSELNRLAAIVISLWLLTAPTQAQTQRPNILFAISDDQSHIHTSFAGSRFVETPAFDRIAREGVYFVNAYAGSPGCAPSRSALVTGRHHWQNEQSGQHASAWLKKYVPFVDLLAFNGYATGRTGKGVGPFRYADDSTHAVWRAGNAGGPEHSYIQYDDQNDPRSASGIRNLDYFANFKYFMEHERGEQPFFFWYGSSEPHRRFEEGSWRSNGKSLADAEVPAFLPDNATTRGDLLDYAVEIEWFDHHLELMIQYLEEIGELENTVIIVTSDNGMSFPRAKANSYEYGVRVPLAIRYPLAFGEGLSVDIPVSFIDIAPTILEITNTSSKEMFPITGKSLLPLLTRSPHPMTTQRPVYTGRERHSSSRYQNWGYPQRTVRKGDYLLIWNMKPDRWPAGAPQRYAQEDSSVLLNMFSLDKNAGYTQDDIFTDIDACPTLDYMINHLTDKEIRPYLLLCCDKRPEFELYDVADDPECLNNLADLPAFETLRQSMFTLLKDELIRTGDPRVTGPDKEIFDSYKRYSPMRYFPKPVPEDHLIISEENGR